eukprot:640367-Rhodomonas_salina.2
MHDSKPGKGSKKAQPVSEAIKTEKWKLGRITNLWACTGFRWVGHGASPEQRTGIWRNARAGGRASSNLRTKDEGGEGERERETPRTAHKEMKMCVAERATS